MKSIFILSLARSGSTFLEMLLVGHPKLVGVGEVAHVLRLYNRRNAKPRKLRRCSCGSMPSECRFWSPLLPRLQATPRAEGFRCIERHFDALYPDKIAVDNSKSWDALEQYYLRERREVRVLFLVRDYRGWSRSLDSHLARDGRWRRGLVVNGYRWLLAQLQTLVRLQRSGVPFMLVRYESLVFDRRRELRAVSKFIGVDVTGVDRPGQGESHELLGNSARLEERRSADIIYDQAWLDGWQEVLLAPFLLPVHGVSRRLARIGRNGED